MTSSFYFEPCVHVYVIVRQVDEVMLTLKQAFATAAALQTNKTEVQLCEACPMHDLHKLCERIEGDSHSRGLVSGIMHKHLDAWGVSERRLNKNEDSYSLLCLQDSTHREQS